MSAPQKPEAVQKWLRQRPALAELARAFPDEWRTVQGELERLGAEDDPEAVHAYVASLAAPARSRSSTGRRAQSELVRQQVRRHMAAAAVQQARLTAATGVTRGRVRFNLVNGFIAQKLLFSHDLERKPVSMASFRLLWPLLRQRRLLMPLVEPKGIYCFYSSKLIGRLAELIAGRRCLEIAAGDGTLARFLADAGVEITATDDHSWRQSVAYPKTVRQLDARSALKTYRPEVVLCSWPPPGNAFERDVFKTREVELYIVIAGRSEHAAGNWAAYGEQTAFTFAEEPKLSRLVLPPEIDPAVYVFRRS